MRSAVFLILVSLFGVMFLSGCSEKRTAVNGPNGAMIGQVHTEGDSEATIYNAHDAVVAHVRGNLVRDAQGKRLGTVLQQKDVVILQDATDNPAGSLDKGVECHGKSPKVLGTLAEELKANIAGGACIALALGAQ
jgi:hypothetical protein